MIYTFEIKTMKPIKDIIKMSKEELATFLAENWVVINRQLPTGREYEYYMKHDEEWLRGAALELISNS
jgi:hypothetical protein